MGDERLGFDLNDCLIIPKPRFGIHDLLLFLYHQMSILVEHVTTSIPRQISTDISFGWVHIFFAFLDSKMEKFIWFVSFQDVPDSSSDWYIWVDPTSTCFCRICERTFLWRAAVIAVYDWKMNALNDHGGNHNEMEANLVTHYIHARWETTSTCASPSPWPFKWLTTDYNRPGKYNKSAQLLSISSFISLSCLYEDGL